MRFRHVAPAGAPIRPSDLARWTARVGPPARARSRLQQAISQRFAVPHIHLTSTGRAGLTLLLRALRAVTGDGRDEVLLPSYTCFSVAASIVKAGLRPRIVDVSPETLDYDAEALSHCDTGRALAIVATNLYGLPNDMPRLTAFARDHRLHLVDDAAQAMGARVGGRASGTWGTAGLYSFDKGKNVSAIDGGAIVTNDDRVHAALAGDALEPAGAAHTASGLAKLAAYVALLPPSLYWLPNALPQAGLGLTRYTTDFPLAQLAAPFAALAETMLGRLDAFTRARCERARWLDERLPWSAGLSRIQPVAGTEPVYLRYPLLVQDRRRRDDLLAALNAEGIGATGSYPASVADVPELRELLAGGPPRAAGGRAVAERIVTLPTHPYVAAADLDRMLRVVERMAAGGAPSAARTAVAR